MAAGNINREGLTYTEWLRAAARKPAPILHTAWKNGEDPTEFKGKGAITKAGAVEALSSQLVSAIQSGDAYRIKRAEEDLLEAQAATGDRTAKGQLGSRKAVFSVSFEYLRNGRWTPTYDHRVVATDAESAIRSWKGAGYGPTRSFVATEIST